jgi:hypothetical protein
VPTRVFCQGVDPSLHVEHRHTVVKQYWKCDRALRTETTFNDTYDFGIGRSLKNFGELVAKGKDINRRLLAMEQAAQRCTPQPPYSRIWYSPPATPTTVLLACVSAILAWSASLAPCLSSTGSCTGSAPATFARWLNITWPVHTPWARWPTTSDVCSAKASSSESPRPTATSSLGWAASLPSSVPSFYSRVVCRGIAKLHPEQLPNPRSQRLEPLRRKTRRPH